MRGRLIGVDITERKQKLTLELDGDFRLQYDELKDGDVTIAIKKFHKKRSLGANGLLWVYIDQIASKTGIDKVTVYREHIRGMGGVSEMVCVADQAVQKLCDSWHKMGLGWITDSFPNSQEGFTNVVLYYGSSTFDTATMNRLLQNVQQDAKELGIDIISPEDASLLEEY